MNGSKFDRLTRTLARGVSRRGILVTAGALALGKGQPSIAAQLTPSTCAAAGEVCTLMRGCCDALTCVTSAINTNYGVCVPGDGGTVAIGTTLISPFSEGAQQEVAALAADATTDTTSTTTTATDLEAEREARIAEKKARKDDQRNDQQLRKQSQETEQRDRREDRRLARDAQRLARDARRGPRLQLQLFNPGGASGLEQLKVTNRDDGNVFLTRIEPLLLPKSGVSLELPQFELSPGESFLFLSGIVSDATEDQIGWISQVVCTDTSGDGFLVNAALTVDSENFD